MEAHPACQFCQQRGAAGRALRFYGSDELFTHMQHEHYSCHVCLRRRGDYNYFRTAPDLVQHLRCGKLKSRFYECGSRCSFMALKSMNFLKLYACNLIAPGLCAAPQVWQPQQF